MVITQHPRRRPRPSTRGSLEPRSTLVHTGGGASTRTQRRRDPHGTTARGGGQRLGATAVARLVKLAAVGHQRGWDGLIEEFGGLIRAVARAHRLNDADCADVAQATWMRLFTHLADLRDPASVGAWLATTARRECLRVIGVRGRLEPFGLEPAEQIAGDAPADNALMAAERDDALWRAFAQLRPSDQALLRLLMADPAPGYKQIAAELEIPIGSIGPTRARALERLRRQINRQGSHALLTH
jgi:RNA polymerase sigma factor (sigma-70 family)